MLYFFLHQALHVHPALSSLLKKKSLLINHFICHFLVTCRLSFTIVYLIGKEYTVMYYMLYSGIATAKQK